MGAPVARVDVDRHTHCRTDRLQVGDQFGLDAWLVAVVTVQLGTIEVFGYFDKTSFDFGQSGAKIKSVVHGAARPGMVGCGAVRRGRVRLGKSRLSDLGW